METRTLNQKILAITMLIEEKHPELSNYLLEMPVTIPNQDHPNIDENMLEDYYQSLCKLLKDYDIEHP
jgi:hypothetical protein